MGDRVDEGIVNHVTDMLEMYTDSSGENWVFPLSVNARVFTWQGAEMWRCCPRAYSPKALEYVAQRLIEAHISADGKDTAAVKDAIASFENDPSFESLVELAHVLKGKA